MSSRDNIQALVEKGKDSLNDECVLLMIRNGINFKEERTEHITERTLEIISDITRELAILLCRRHKPNV